MPALSRRELFHLTTAGVGAFAASGWLDRLAARAADAPAAPAAKAKRCILLWMDGGPSHHDTFDMKPDAPDDIRGEFKPIQSSVTDLPITEKFPLLAKQMKHVALVRGMSTGESEHGRARQYLHTGYKTGAGGLQYPTMGAMMTAAAGAPADAEMPNFVVTGMHLNPANWSYVASPGHLGPRHTPLIVADPAGGVPNLKPAVADAEFADRLGVLEELADGFHRDRPAPATTGQATAYQVYHAPTAGGWDNHTGVRAKEVKAMAMPQLDQGMSALLADLADRGLHDSTLVIWMGEFGRTPKVKPDGGRDHYAKAWTTAFVGGGVKGGQAIGRTDKTGATVEDKPVSAADFMATVCGLLGVSVDAEFKVGERPVRAVDKGATPIKGLV